MDCTPELKSANQGHPTFSQVSSSQLEGSEYLTLWLVRRSLCDFLVHYQDGHPTRVADRDD